MIRRIKIAAGLTKQWWGYRSSFASNWQAAKAVWARLVATHSLRRGASERGISLRVKGGGSPIELRLGNIDIIIFEEVFLKQEYEHALSLAGNQGWVVDLGGNIGLAARYFSDRLPHPVHSIEPDDGNLELLKRNNADAIANGRVSFRRAFVAATEGQSAIDRSVQPAGYRMVPSSDDTPAESLIDCVPMTTILADAGIDQVALLKCDIEGAEAELFVECQEWIHRVNAMVVETHAPYSPETLAEDLARADWLGEVVSLTRRGKYAVVHYKRRSQ